jgi:hypothetical protein
MNPYYKYTIENLFREFLDKALKLGYEHVHEKKLDGETELTKMRGFNNELERLINRLYK